MNEGATNVASQQQNPNTQQTKRKCLLPMIQMRTGEGNAGDEKSAAAGVAWLRPTQASRHRLVINKTDAWT